MKKTNLIEIFLLNDLKENVSQSSWDWEADLRFAYAIDHPKKKLIEDVVNSETVWPIRYGILKSTGITAKRLRYLRKLVNKKLVISYWIGSGWGGQSEFGLKRVRNYRLIKDEE